MTTRIRRWQIALGVIVLVTVAYAITGFVGVPRLLRSQLLSFVSAHYGRAASIGEIRFNPFTLTLDARDFSFPDADGKPLIAFGRLVLNLDVASVWRLAPSFSEIGIERPFVRAQLRKDGTLNLAELGKPFADAAAPPPPPDAKPARLFVDRLDVSAGSVTYEDDSRATPFRAQLQPISFELRNFSTTARTDNTYALAGASASGEKFAWNGSLSVAPLGSQGRFEVTDLQAHTVWSYLRDSLGFELSSGLISFNGEYRFAAAPALALNVDVHTVSVADLGIRPAGQQAEYIQHASVQLDDTRLDLAGQRVAIGKIVLAGGTVRAWRDEQGAINLMDLMPAPGATATAAATSPPAAAPASQWVFAAPDIAIGKLRVEIEDRLVKPSAGFILDPINVTVRGYTTAPGKPLDVEAGFRINDSAQLQAKAQVSPDSGAVAAHVDLDAFDLASLQPYVNAYTRIRLLSGVLKTGLDIQRTANGALEISGDTEVSKFRTIDRGLRQDFVKWDALKLEGLRYRSAPQSLGIRTITARAPYARVVIAPDQTLNIVEATTPMPGTAPPAVQTVQDTGGAAHATAGNPGGMRIDIGTVHIVDGAANFADFWIQPNYSVSLQGMNGSVVGLSSDPQSRAKVTLEGKVDRYAPAKIGGEINLLSAALFTDMKVSFDGVEMNSVTPYSGHFAGYKIDKGKLSVDVSYHVENRKLEAKQRFVVDQLQLGEPVESPDAVHLPLRLAVALLRDRNGVIDLELPLTGSLDDPQFRVGPLVWKVFVNVLTKAVTAPFALLGSLFGGGEEMNLIDFQPGAAVLDTAAQERLASLGRALRERPQLELDVPVSYATEADGAVLAAQKLHRQLQALLDRQARTQKNANPQTLDAVLADPARRFDLLLAQYRLDNGAGMAPPLATAILAMPREKVDPATFPAAGDELERAITTRQPITESELEELAQARARAIQDSLLGSGEIDPARVFLLGAKATPVTESKVRVALSLK
ncbi:MAG: DUF748 domain-containing protein [Pseudomonadota bacterium]